MKRIFIVLFIIAMASDVAAQRMLTLDEAIETALKNNAAVKAAAAEAESQTQLRKTSFNLPKTDVMLMYGQYNTFANDNNVTITQNIPFTTLGSEGKLNRSLAAAAQLKKATSENELIFQVKTTYYALLYAKARQTLLIRLDSLFEDFYNAASLRYKTGESKLLEQTTADVQRNEIKNQIRENDGSIHVLQTKISSLLNVDEFVDGLPAPLTPRELKEVPDTIIYQSNPALAYVRHQVDVAESQRKLEAAKFAPDFMIGYFNQTLIGTPNPESSRVTTRSTRFSGVQVGIALPLWFVPHQARVKAARFNREAAQYNYKNFQITIKSELTQAVQQYAKNKNSLDYYHQSALPNSDLILKQSNAAFKEGEIGYAEHLLSLRNVISIQEGYLRTLNDYNQSVVYIEYLSGNK